VRLIYRARKDSALEREADLLASIYKVVLDCHAKKAADTSRVCRPKTEVRNKGEVSHVDQQPG
jgi:hypothetical protein